MRWSSLDWRVVSVALMSLSQIQFSMWCHRNLIVFSILTFLPFPQLRNLFSISDRNLDDSSRKRVFKVSFNLINSKMPKLTFAGIVVIFLLPRKFYASREFRKGFKIVPGIWGVSTGEQHPSEWRPRSERRHAGSHQGHLIFYLICKDSVASKLPQGQCRHLTKGLEGLLGSTRGY